MGYTSFTVEKLEEIFEKYNPKSVIDLGAQNLYNQPLLPAPYASTYYDKKGIAYACIDLSNENNSLLIDLSKPLVDWDIEQADLLVDAGTSEHVGDNGVFSWEAIYNCWKTKHELLKIGGIMFNENPKSGNWLGHGFNYHTQEFYNELAAKSDYEILDLGEHPAMGNVTDGWNVFCTLRKRSDKFPELADFKLFSIKKS